MTGPQHNRHFNGEVIAISPVGIITVTHGKVIHGVNYEFTTNPSVGITIWNSEQRGLQPTDKNGHWGVTTQFATELEALGYAYDMARFWGITNLI